MQRISYTADLLAKTIPMMMAKAAAEKSLGENPGATIPDEIKNTMVLTSPDTLDPGPGTTHPTL